MASATPLWPLCALARPTVCIAGLILVLSIASPASAATPASLGISKAEGDAVALVSRMTPNEKYGQMINTAPAIPRLGVPAYQWWNEALHGVVSNQTTTNFPEPIGLAATFDQPLVFEIGRAISTEMQSVYGSNRLAGRSGALGTGLDVWAPNINIYRDPRWGRGQETYGEDPFLTGRMGVAYIEGIQGSDFVRPEVIATPKHFAVHSGPESTRHTADVTVSRHDLEDTYLPAFRAAVVEAKAGSVMCAYNSINGEPACANDFLLKTTLRDAWGFKGYIVSDCEAVVDIDEKHRFTANGPASVGAAVKAGMDNECGFTPSQVLTKRYADAVASQLLPAPTLDQALVRLFTARYALGELGQPRSWPTALASSTLNDHAELALKSAEESIVLLTNTGVLPLPARQRIAVIGPLADATRVLRGNYSSGHNPDAVSALAGIREAFPHAEVSYVPAGAFIGDGDPIPTSVLTAPDGQPGLLARYFEDKSSYGQDRLALDQFLAKLDTSDTAGPLSLARHELGIDWSWGAGDPTRPDHSMIAWSGFLTPPRTGVYRLGLKGMNGILLLDGKPISRVGADLSGLGDLEAVKLDKGRRYKLLIISKTEPILELHLVWKRISDTPETDAVASARAADVVIAVVGLTSDLEGEETQVKVPGFAGGDRTSLDLPTDQQALLEAVKATGKPLIVVVMSGGALNLSWAKGNAQAILQAWYPGEQGGAALGRILSGAANPSGRLPVTFYRDVTQLPPFADYAMANRTYRYFTGDPVFAFGFGLSYTTFAYGPLSIVPNGVDFSDGATITTTVTNIGSRAGEEVTQLYLTLPQTPGAPRIALRGFKRVSLKPGSTARVTFHLAIRDLDSVSPGGDHRVQKGSYLVNVGSGQPGTGIQETHATFDVPTQVDLPR